MSGRQSHGHFRGIAPYGGCRLPRRIPEGNALRPDQVPSQRIRLAHEERVALDGITQLRHPLFFHPDPAPGPQIHFSPLVQDGDELVPVGIAIQIGLEIFAYAVPKSLFTQ